MRVLAEVAAIVAGGVGAAVCLAVLTVRLPQGGPVFEPGLRPPVKTAVWPAQLVRLERVVRFSASSGQDANNALRPVLVEIAEARLARRGLRLDRMPPRRAACSAPPRGSSSARTARRRAIPAARASRAATSSRSSTRWTRCDRAERSHAELTERAARILDEVERAVVGKRPVLELVLMGLLADGHVLIEDNPGVAKTLIARSFAAVTGLRFARVQSRPI